MRRALVLALLALCACLAAACGESPRRRFIVPLEGQSPPEPPAPPPSARIVEPPPLNSAAADSPVWLRQNAPVEWTAPAGWEQDPSTKPNRIVEFTVEKSGPGGAPIQFVILNGADEHPGAKVASLTRAQTMYREDRAPQETRSEHDGLKITRHVIHGTFEGPPLLGASQEIKEDNWTLLFGWVEGPSGSVMFKFQGPDKIVEANMSKVDALLASMKPRTRTQ